MKRKTVKEMYRNFELLESVVKELNSRLVSQSVRIKDLKMNIPITRLEKEDSDWIRCEDRLPELSDKYYGDSKRVLVYQGNEDTGVYGITISYLRVSKKGKATWMAADYMRPYDVTYWRPLVDIPTNLEKKK